MLIHNLRNTNFADQSAWQVTCKPLGDRSLNDELNSKIMQLFVKLF